MKKIQQWPNIKTEDCQALRSYVMYLRGCCYVMRELRYMRELDTAANLRVILAKLPYTIKEKWRTAANDILEETNQGWFERSCDFP